MVKLAYVNTDSYLTGVYDDFLLEFQGQPIRRPDGTMIPRAADGFVDTVEMASVVRMLEQAGYTIAGSWEVLSPVTARVVVTSETAGYHQSRKHAVHCPYGPPNHTTWHHTGICDEHWMFRTFP